MKKTPTTIQSDANNGVSNEGSEIVQNYPTFTAPDFHSACPHSFVAPNKEEKETIYLPWVIKVYAEGGLVHEIECLECAIDAAQDMGMKIRRKRK